MNAARGEPWTKRVRTRHSRPRELVTLRTLDSALVACMQNLLELWTDILFSGVILSPMDVTHAIAYFGCLVLTDNCSFLVALD